MATPGPVPDDIAAEVAEFVRARSHDPLPASAPAIILNQRLADSALVRDYARALEWRRRMTADNLALTLLLVAARFVEHPDYQRRWLLWTPFGELDPAAQDAETEPGPHQE